MTIFTTTKNMCIFDYKYSKTDNMIAFGIVIIVYNALFNGAVFSIFDRFGLPGKQIVDIGLFAIESLILFMGLLCAFQRKPLLTVTSYMLVGIVYLLTIIIYPDNRSILLGTSKQMIAFCLPALIFCITLPNKDILWRKLYAGRYVMVVCGIIYAIFADTETYSMWLGYQMLLPTMLLTWQVVNGKARFYDAILWIVAGMIMLIKGSRGPILILAIYAICAFIFYNCNSKEKPHKAMVTYIYGPIAKKAYSPWAICFCCFGGLIILYILLNLQEIAGWLYDFFLGHGYNIRSLQILRSGGGIFYTSGRDIISANAIQAIMKRPLLGYGLGGDCVYIGNVVYGLPPEASTGYYAHNLLLELCMHWGLLGGCMAFVIYIIIIASKWKSTRKNSHYNDLMLIFSIYGLICSMMSNTYLENSILWLLLGLSLPIMEKVKRCDTEFC